MSLPQSRAEAALDIVANDKATPVVKRTVDGVNREWKDLRREQQMIRREYEINNRTLIATEKVLQKVGTIAGTVTTIWTKWNVAQLRVSDANRTVRETLDDYNRALAEFGPTSTEAMEANRDYQKALEDQKRAQDEARFGMIALGFEGAQAIGQMISLIPRIKELAGAIRGIGTASTLTAAAAAGGTTVLPGMVGAGKAGGGLKGNLISAGKFAAKVAPPLIGGAAAYEYFKAPGDQTGLTGNPIGDFINDAAANGINFISENLGFGRVAATAAELKAQTGGGGGGNTQINYFQGYDLGDAQRIANSEAETMSVYEG